VKLLVLRGKDKSRTIDPARDLRTPVAEMKGLPVRVTTFRSAERSHGAEAVLVLERGRILSVVASAGEMKLYLSPRAEFRCIAPDDPPKGESAAPLKPTGGDICPPCLDGCHTMCCWSRNVDHGSQCECTHSSHYGAGGGQ
jgi:hypothetical protein